MARARSIQQQFGERVRSLRHRANLSQEEAAYRCKVSRTYLSQLEAGKRNPSLTSIQKIAAAFKLTVSELLKLE